MTSGFCSLLTLSETVAMPKAVKSTKSSVLVGFLEPFEKTVTKPPLAKAIFAVFFVNTTVISFEKATLWKYSTTSNKNRCQAIPTRLRNPVTFYACVRHWRCVLTQFCVHRTVFTLTHFVRGWARTEGCIVEDERTGDIS